MSDTGKKHFIKKVEWPNRLSKWYLRPYVDPSGSAFSSGDVSESKLLSVEFLGRNALSQSTSEWCSRPGFA
eukprot:1604979-Amphidinium_carterae.2